MSANAEGEELPPMPTEGLVTPLAPLGVRPLNVRRRLMSVLIQTPAVPRASTLQP